MKLVWLNCKHFCGGVVVNKSNIIVEAPPICRKFLNQNFDALLKWLLRKDLLKEWKVFQKIPHRKEQVYKLEFKKNRVGEPTASRRFARRKGDAR